MRAGTSRIKCFQDQSDSLPFTHWGTAFTTGQLSDTSDHHSISSCDTKWEMDPDSEDTTGYHIAASSLQASQAGEYIVFTRV